VDNKRVTSPADLTLFDRLNAALPQTQCARCGYPNCAAYAQAIAGDNASTNQCPPGGLEGVERLAAITGQPAQWLNPANGVEGPRAIAVIDEAWCIGCTLCIKACPTDAILGSIKMMHTVIEAYCTGCELCVPVCPVDCISLENVTGTRTGWAAWSQADADLARDRYEFNRYRRQLDKNENDKRLRDLAQAKFSDLAKHSQITDPEILDRKRAIIEAAMARARTKRGPA
jgi:electron transport complex protein RnfB